MKSKHSPTLWTNNNDTLEEMPLPLLAPSLSSQISVLSKASICVYCFGVVIHAGSSLLAGGYSETEIQKGTTTTRNTLKIQCLYKKCIQLKKDSTLQDVYASGILSRRIKRKTGMAIKPFVKWVGGKGQLLPSIRHKYPLGLGKVITRYCEPFVVKLHIVGP